MRPLKLTLQAFGSYGKQTLINFEEPNQNLFLITGDTGAGKTTIFDAIVFALYGEASSTANKKDGAELQSQYVRQNVQPFVELTFFEGAGGNPDVYTVRRVPRHQRPRKRGEGMTDEKESVSLTMPDGSEYPQKETDKKLEEIIGLTKNQFMQVAMIAQGEFMELLRAKSDTKKVIFRKLFGTEIFQKIVDELGERKKKKEKEIATIRTVFQTEAAHLRIPEGYERAEELAAFKRRITTAARLSVTDMEELLQELDVLCGALETGERLAYEEYQKASEFRDKKRDAYAGAEHLLKFFRQLEEAEADLAVCQEAEASMKRAKALIGKLRAAYEIRAEFQRYEDARKAEADMRTRRKEQQELLPELERAAGEAKEKEAEKKKLFEQELESFSRISERVEKARKLFDTIRDAQRETVQREKTFRKAESIAEEKRKSLSDLEEQEKVWRRQCDELGDAEKRLALWKVKRMEAEALEKEAREERNQQMEVDGQRRSAKKAKEDYAAASQAYEKENIRYEKMRKDFLDLQAGVLARELRPGIPCPVCGSLEHPAPCQWEEKAQEISREEIDILGEEAGRLRSVQEERAAAAKAEQALLSEKEKILEHMSARLLEHMARSLPDVPKEMTPEQTEKILADWTKAVLEEGKKAEENARRLRQIQESLKGAEEEKKERKAEAEQGQKDVRAAEAAWERSKAALESLEKGRDFPTLEDALRAESEAKQRKREKDTACQAARMAAEKAGAKKDEARTLIQKYTQELPEKEKQRTERQTAYERILAQKGLSETEWRELTQKHEREEADALQKTVDAHERKKATALRMQADAKKAVENRKRPVLEDMKREMEEAEQRRKEAQSVFERCRAEHKTNTEIYGVLEPQMDERKRMVEEHTKLDNLYRLVSGNVTGSRMDLETYVQRYYLERILSAANRRFQEMSAGQFELRMYELEKAGEGKNRGLDLMVYSTVTGKEREIRTLSGGESFMAALSLALGMADQIQESSASIHLDVMFIDEGFGSLDEHSRNQAVRVLQEMAGGSKLIGIISHVTELKQEIENQLIVQKDENGSHVRWQIS